jgi:hypothetical protein
VIARHADPAVDLLLQRQAIHDVMVRYAYGVDTRNFEMVADCFTPDVDAPLFKQHNRDDLVRFISGVQHFHTTMHMMGNQFIGVNGDRATAASYAMLTHRADPDAGGMAELDTTGSIYPESAVWREGAWRIERHGGEPTWSVNDLGSLAPADADVQWLLDRASLYDLMTSYALGIDQRDYDRIRRCFASTFHAVYGPMGAFEDADELIAFIKGVEHFASTTHFLGTHLAEVEGDSGRMETYALITHREDGDRPEWTVAGDYRDEIERVDGRWAIVERGPGAAAVALAPPEARRAAEPAIQYLLDRAAIRDLVATSVLAVDRRTWDVFEACHAGAADVDGTRAAVERWETTAHLVNNDFVEIDGDEARVETYAYVTHGDGQSLPSPWMDGARRLVDHVQRGPEGWRIVERQVLDNRIERAASA